MHEGRTSAEGFAKRVGNEKCVYGENGYVGLVALIERNAHDEEEAGHT